MKTNYERDRENNPRGRHKKQGKRGAEDAGVDEEALGGRGARKLRRNLK